MFGFRENIEALGRKLRNYISPSSYDMYFKLKRKTSSFNHNSTPVIAMEFVRPDIDKVGGRYLYYLFHEFSTLGMPIAIQLNYSFIASFCHKKYKKLILSDSLLFYQKSEELPHSSILLTDKSDTPEHLNFSKVITLKFGELTPSKKSEFGLPFSTHPMNLKNKNNQLRLISARERSRRIFFSGESQPTRYDKKMLTLKYDMLSRFEALETIRDAMSKEVWTPELVSLIDIKTRREDRIPHDQWMSVLSTSIFFLALPGAVMPMCHNAVEALSVGSVPILQYPQYFDPPLQDGINCLTYNSKSGLISAISTALRMPIEKSQGMTNSCLDYYDEYLRLGKFSNKLVSSKFSSVSVLVDSYRVPRTFPDE